MKKLKNFIEYRSQTQVSEKFTSQVNVSKSRSFEQSSSEKLAKDAETLQLVDHQQQVDLECIQLEEDAAFMRRPAQQAILSVIVPAETVKACISQAGYDFLRSILPFFSAGGRVWAVFFFFKKKPDSNSKSQRFDDRSTKSYSLFFTTSKSGLVTKKLWKSIIERFVGVRKPNLGKAGAILPFDHLMSHEEGSSLRLLEHNKTDILFFIPHSSHILQPAGNVAFARLKRTQT
jgi:hypothetical protein